MLLKKELENQVKRLPFDYKNCTKYSLVYGYKNYSDDVKPLYYYAVLLRYWYETRTLYRELSNLINALHLTFEDVIDLYVDSITKALNYIDLTKYEEKTDVERDKMLNSYIYGTIDTMRINFVQYHSYDKRKLNIEAMSLDNELDDDGNTLEIEDEKNDYNVQMFLAEIDNIISDLIQSNHCFEALLLYLIVYDDLFTYKNETQKYEYSFKKLVNVLRDISSEEFNLFINKYNVSEELADCLRMYTYYGRSWLRVLHSNAIKFLKKYRGLISICY